MNKKSIWFFDVFNTCGGAQKSSATLINYLYNHCKESVNVKFISIEKGTTTYESSVESEIVFLGIENTAPLYDIKRRFWKAFFPSLKLIKRLADLTKTTTDNNKDLVTVVTSSVKGLIYLVATKLFFRVQLRVAYYCRGDGNIRSSMVLRVLRSSLVDRILTVSSRTKDVIVQSGIGSEKVVVVYTSVDAREIRRQANYTSEPVVLAEPTSDSKVLLYAASIIKTKGLHILLEALFDTEWDSPKHILLIAGSAPKGDLNQYEQKCRRLASRLNLRTHWLGWRTDVPRLINESDIVCLPSLSEGFPRIVQESMFLKRLVIGTDVGGTLELLNGGELGFVAEPNSIESLRRALDNALELSCNSKRLKIKVERAHDHFMKHYEISNQHKRFLDELVEL